MGREGSALSRALIEQVSWMVFLRQNDIGNVCDDWIDLT